VDSFINNGSIDVTSSVNMVWADQIRNKGSMSAPATGMIQLRGNNVILTNSALVIQAIGGVNTGCLPFDFLGLLQNVTPTNYFAEVGFRDTGWSSEILTNAPSGILTAAGGVSTPRFALTNANGGVQRISLNLPAPFIAANTNQLDDTNFVAQGVFVQTSDADLQVDVRFIDSPIDSASGDIDGYQTVIVRLFQPTIDLITGNTITNQIFIIDSLAKTTNFTGLTNLLGANEQRPAPYLVTRRLPCEFDTLPTGNVTNDLALLDAIFNVPGAAPITTNQQVAYAFMAEGGGNANFGTLTPPSITNITGRVEIIANSLDMTRTRIRGEGLVDIKAEELVGSRRAIIDSVNYNLDLGNSTELGVTSIVPPFVNRVNTLGLPVRVWSGLWTNVVNTEIVTPDPTDPALPPTTNIVSTNYIFHATVVDAGSVNTRVPTIVHQFRAHSDVSGPSIVRIDDLLRIQEEFSIEARNIVINNEVSLDNASLNWDNETVPNAETVLITPTGALNVFDLANLGGERRYLAVTNQGVIVGNTGVRINANYFENSGDIFSGGILAVVADEAVIDGREWQSLQDITFTNRTLRIAETAFTTPGNLVFNVSESLFDHPTRANEWTARGIQLVRRPGAGDLMGTRVVLQLNNFGLSENVFASTRNVGDSAAGFVENLAIGNLVLEGGSGSLYVFQAPDSSPTAIYVDLLEISPQVAADLEGSISIAQNVTIYFADVRGADLDTILNTSFPGGGRFVWVPGFASSRSGVDFTLPSGDTVTINRLLGEQDEDADGTKNAEDPDFVPRTQLSGLTFNRGGNSFTFSWLAPAKSVTYLESTDNPRAGNWELLKTYSNAFNRSRGYTSDPVPTDGPKQRFYRVRIMR
jgi:hypothetical protein